MDNFETLQSVRFITVKGKRFVVLPIETWETLIEWLEDIEDCQIAEEALRELETAGGDPEKAGWLKWEDVVKVLAKDLHMLPEEKQ